MRDLEVFLPGELVDLCVPDERFALESEWHSWFNNPNITRYLDQGAFPVTPEDQREFFINARKERLILILRAKKSGSYMGVCSFSFINMHKRAAVLSLVIDAAKEFKLSSLIALEAIARITEHGFITMGLNRIVIGQDIRLAGWGQRMELMGYRVEGLGRQSFIKGRLAQDEIFAAATFESYEAIILHRKKLWDSAAEMRRRLDNLPTPRFIDRLQRFLADEGGRYYEALARL